MKRKLSVLLVIGLLICIKCQDLMYKKYYIRMYNLVLLFKAELESEILVCKINFRFSISLARLNSGKLKLLYFSGS